MDMIKIPSQTIFSKFLWVMAWNPKSNNFYDIGSKIYNSCFIVHTAHNSLHEVQKWQKYLPYVQTEINMYKSQHMQPIALVLSIFSDWSSQLLNFHRFCNVIQFSHNSLSIGVTSTIGKVLLLEIILCLQMFFGLLR